MESLPFAESFQRRKGGWWVGEVREKHWLKRRKQNQNLGCKVNNLFKKYFGVAFGKGRGQTKILS